MIKRNTPCNLSLTEDVLSGVVGGIVTKGKTKIEVIKIRQDLPYLQMSAARYFAAESFKRGTYYDDDDTLVHQT